MSLDTKISSFLKSPVGKQKIAEAKAEALKAGRTFGQPGGTVISKASAQEAAEKMCEILITCLADVNLQTILPQDIIIQEPVIKQDGTVVIGLSFDTEAVKRSSLVPAKYDGVENIVVHLTHGWSARGSVEGYWESAGHTTWSRQFFAGDDFMQEAVDTFNGLKLGVAELSDEYKT